MPKKSSRQLRSNNVRPSQQRCLRPRHVRNESTSASTNNTRAVAQNRLNVRGNKRRKIQEVEGNGINSNSVSVKLSQ